MQKNFSGLRVRMSAEAQAKARALAAKYSAEMPLDELREARGMTQVHLANVLGVNQAAISKMEHRTDMYITTLQSFVKALGGQLKIEAIFPDGKVRLVNSGNSEGRR